MAIDPQRIINSSYSINLASWLGHIVPPKSGYRLSIWIADFISSHQDWKLVQATRANQWVVHGEPTNKKLLDNAVQGVFRNTACSIYDLYHNSQNIEALRQRIDFNSDVEKFLKRPAYAERGLIVVGVHMSNFDFVLQAVCREGLEALVLTLPKLAGGHKEQFLMRQKSGMRLLPASISALRQAIDHLRAGGLVVTGIDRPDTASDYYPTFFGKPAALPVHHIYLAKKANVPVVVGTTILQNDKRYHLYFSEPIEMLPDTDRRKETIHNAERVLQVAESFIRMAPQQWSMTLPVWPAILNQVP
ncbi:MAG: lysophospholipid acyltransferase family protein [Anaerolineales bacterium]|nr:lysophospholipid acyltransferase family protein [Anaerolineales bacterium]